MYIGAACDPIAGAVIAGLGWVLSGISKAILEYA